MDEMSSVEFRKRYAKLTEPVTVTVQGHPIGLWTPIRSHPDSYLEKYILPLAEARAPLTIAPAAPVFRPFTPVPKTGKKG